MQVYKIGDRGSAITEIQKKLRAAGYKLGPRGIDSYFGIATKEAVISFQKNNKLPADGIVGITTWKTLLEKTYKLGDRLLYLHSPFLRGNDVFSLQTILAQLGFRIGKIDGIFGQYTDKVVREFQSNLLLPADGIVGSATLKSLKTLQGIIENQPRELLPWKLMRPQSKDKPLKGTFIKLNYVSPYLRSKKNLVRQIANLLKIAGANVHILSSKDKHGSKRQKNVLPENITINIHSNDNNRSLNDITIGYSKDMQHFANLTQKTLKQIAGIKTSKICNKQFSGRLISIDIKKSREMEMYSNEELFQKFAVSIADAVSSQLCKS